LPSGDHSRRRTNSSPRPPLRVIPSLCRTPPVTIAINCRVATSYRSSSRRCFSPRNIHVPLLLGIALRTLAPDLLSLQSISARDGEPCSGSCWARWGRGPRSARPCAATTATRSVRGQHRREHGGRGRGGSSPRPARQRGRGRQPGPGDPLAVATTQSPANRCAAPLPGGCRSAEGDLGHVWPDMAWLARRVPATATAQDGPKVGVARSPTEVTRAFARIDRTMRWQMPTLADVLKARFQISAHLRQTPLLGYPTG
jgi:hypothetical protein